VQANLVTYHLMRGGKVQFTGFDESARTPQEFAESVAGHTNRDYADEIHVWFARDEEPDAREPDAIARVEEIAEEAADRG
jgi:hypothetical protein